MRMAATTSKKTRTRNMETKTKKETDVWNHENWLPCVSSFALKKMGMIVPNKPTSDKSL